MKRYFQLLLTFTLISKNLSSQSNSTNTCNCSDNLKILINKTEENYAGYLSKAKNKNSIGYKKHIQHLVTKAVKVTNPKLCFYILKEYVRFFEDKHFTLSYQNENDYDYEIINITENDYKKNTVNKKLHQIEGIWINADSTIKLAIMKTSDNVFKAVVVKSNHPKIPIGLVYMKLVQTPKGFIAKEYNSFLTTDVPAKQKRNLLQIWNFALFGKIYPSQISNDEIEELKTWRANNNGLNFKLLSSKTAYLKIPTFKNNEDQIQQLVLKNDSIIRNSENLIIDITGNGGGSTGWVSILPYIITNPIVQFDSYIRVTPENTKYKLKDLEPFVLHPIPNEYKKYFPKDVLNAYKKAYQELPVTSQEFYPIPGVTFPLDSITKKPSKVALLVDDLCGSSSEYFFFISKQSKKTKTYGINTIGMMDYEGMSNITPLPYPNYYLTIPIVKSSWTNKNPIDKTGFKPDIVLNKIDQVKWVEWLQNHLEKN